MIRRGAVRSGFRHARLDLIERLRAWQAPDDEQDAARWELLGYLNRHPGALDRRCAPTHVTVGVLVIDPAAERMLLHRHRRSGQWWQFGGHMGAEDVDVLAAAAREVGAELAVPLPVRPGLVEVALCPAAAGSRCRCHWDVRFVAVGDDRVRAAAAASPEDLRWFAPDAAGPPDGELEPELRRYYARALAAAE